MNGFSTLTPYIIPPTMTGKKVNLGDGFILRGIERLVGQFSDNRVFSSRIAPDTSQYKSLLESKLVILAGANQLDDTFQVWPGLTADDISQTSFKFIPFGIGMNGVGSRNVSFSNGTLETLKLIHERIEFSSWRCPITVRLIERALPELKGKALMTGCPVVYDDKLLDGTKFHQGSGVVAVTVTERDDFWDRESSTLRFVAKRFPQARRVLVLHQVFGEQTFFEKRFGTIPGASAFLKRRARLHVLARKLGFEIISPPSADAALAFYKNVDLHIGSRLHAHLHFLSQNKRSLLTYVDDRMKGFSEFLKFPLSTPETFENDLGFDLEETRQAAKDTFKTMKQFVLSLEALK